MSFWDAYITSDQSIPSKSGLYANDLPGVTLNLFDSLTKDEQEDYLACWAGIYKLAKMNFISGVTSKMADKFHVNKRLVTRETSEFLKTTAAGAIKVYYNLPKYARVQILTVEIFALTAGNYTLTVRDTDASGEVLFTSVTGVVVGRNVLNVSTDFEVNNLYISGTGVTTYGTQNKYFNQAGYVYDKLSCSFPCWAGGYSASVDQVSGGGLNVKFVIHCSVEKFIEENFNLFNSAFLNRIGVEIMRERILSDRFNRFTTLTKERAEELMAYYKDEYDEHLINSITTINKADDPVCFSCKTVVTAKTLLP